MAKKQRHIYLLEKLQQKKPLSRSELKELSKFEEKEPGSPAILESQEQVARAFGVSARTVANWIKDGMPTTRDGRYDIKDIQAWKFMRGNKPRGKSGNNNLFKASKLEEWDAKYREFKARKEEILYRKAIGELVERKKIEEGLIIISTAIKRALLALPRELAPILAGLEPREIEKKLTEKVKAVINLFAKDQIFSGGEQKRRNVKTRKARNLDRIRKKGLGPSARSYGSAVGRSE